MGPIPGTLIRRRAVRSVLRQLQDGAVDRGDLIVERLQLTDDRRERVPHAKRDGAIALQNRCGQCVGSARSLCSDNADLRQMAAQCVEELCALRHQDLTHLVMHKNGLIVFLVDRQESHRRPSDRFANRSRISRIILLPANIGLNVIGWHQSSERGRV